jgi:hypothetical protein
MDRYNKSEGVSKKLVFVYPLCRSVRQRLCEALPR